MRLYLPLLVLCVQAFMASAQDIAIARIERVSDNVILTYNLVDTLAKSYTVALYSTIDAFTTPLTKVTGDVGIEVRPGLNHRIIWDAKAELGPAFSGKVGLEIRGKVYIPFVRLDGFDDYRSFKRKKSYEISWTGGRGNSVLNFDLYKGDKKIATYPNIANVGHYKLKFEHVKTGKNYRLKITDSKNKDDVVYSAPFHIKAKVPFLFKIVPIAAIGYLIATLGSKSKGDPDIVDPISPGGNN